jgi:hypothetical protein
MQMVQAMDSNYPNVTPLAKEKDGEFVEMVVRWSWILFSISVVFQCLFHFDLVNAMAMFCVFVGWAIATKVFLKISMLRRFPLSSFLVIAFTSTQLYFPLLFTSLEGKPLIYNLEFPEQVFLHSILSLIVLAITHSFYRLLSKMSYSRSFSLLTKAGFFTPPTDLQLWMMGVVGLAAQYYVFFMSPNIGWEVTGGSASDKLVQGLIPFSYAPFFIPFGKLYGNNQVHSKRLVPLLLIFTAVLFAVSVGRNSRGAFMFGFTSVGFAYALGLLLGVFKTRIFTFRNVIVGGLFFWLLTGPMADLGTAMVLVRGEREEIPAAELIELTFEAYGDKEAIRKRRMEDNAEGIDTDWDERYLDNIFTARFANIKFNDMSLVQFSKLREYDPDMLSYSIDYILCALPEPFIKALNIDADKEVIYSLSIGDYLYLSAGGYGYVAGFRTGHFAGTGMATFGWWYLLLLGIGMVPVFLLFDKFYRKKKLAGSADVSESQKIQFSFCGMLALTSIFQFLPNESVVALATFLIRGWIQMALLYFLMFHTTRILSFSRKANNVHTV